MCGCQWDVGGRTDWVRIEEVGEDGRERSSKLNARSITSFICWFHSSAHVILSVAHQGHDAAICTSPISCATVAQLT